MKEYPHFHIRVKILISRSHFHCLVLCLGRTRLRWHLLLTGITSMFSGLSLSKMLLTCSSLEPSPVPKRWWPRHCCGVFFSKALRPSPASKPFQCSLWGLPEHSPFIKSQDLWCSQAVTSWHFTSDNTKIFMTLEQKSFNFESRWGRAWLILMKHKSQPIQWGGELHPLLSTAKGE